MGRMKENLTNEKLKGLFNSNFDLANYAISIATRDIRLGKEVNADNILEEIVRNPKAAIDQAKDEEDFE